MSLTELNLDGAPAPKNINFSDLNAVENFLETEKFRPQYHGRENKLPPIHELIPNPEELLALDLKNLRLSFFKRLALRGKECLRDGR